MVSYTEWTSIGFEYEGEIKTEIGSDDPTDVLRWLAERWSRNPELKEASQADARRALENTLAPLSRPPINGGGRSNSSNRSNRG